MKLLDAINELKLWDYKKIDLHARLEEKEIFIDCSWKEGMMIEYDKKTGEVSCPGAINVEIDPELLWEDPENSVSSIIEIAVIKARAASVNLP
tara:strand:+ start:944 stop:1222 length:279 start_codon:yes stop_codon:yes gene_type:complete